MIIRNTHSEELYLNFLNPPVGRKLAVGATLTCDDLIAREETFKALVDSGKLTVVSYTTTDLDYVVQQELGLTAMKRIDYVEQATEPTVSQVQGVIIWKNTVTSKYYLIFSPLGTYASQIGVELTTTH